MNTILLGVVTVIVIGILTYFTIGAVALIRYGSPETKRVRTKVWYGRGRVRTEYQTRLDDDDPSSLIRAHTELFIKLVAIALIIAVVLATLYLVLHNIGLVVERFILVAVLS